MAKLRLGVTGAGPWAIASHLPNFAKRKDDVEFVAVARKGEEWLAKVKAKWGFGIARSALSGAVARIRQP